MNKKKSVIMCLIFCLVALPAIAGCINGNWHPLMNGVPMTDICCIHVGDGTAASCTDGDTWMILTEGIPEL